MQNYGGQIAKVIGENLHDIFHDRNGAALTITNHVNAQYFKLLHFVICGESPSQDINRSRPKVYYNRDTIEVLNFNTTIPLLHTFPTFRDDLSQDHLCNWYTAILKGEDGSLDHKGIPRKLFEPFSDDNYTLRGSYGYNILQQLHYVVETLKKSPDSRQAVISMWNKNPSPTKDMPCSLTLQFLLRDEKINVVYNMRSSDLYLGFPYDIFTMSMITFFVASQLNKFSRLFGYLIKPGKILFNAGSLHVYYRDLPKIEKFTRKYYESYSKDTLPDYFMVMPDICEQYPKFFYSWDRSMLRKIHRAKD